MKPPVREIKNCFLPWPPPSGLVLVFSLLFLSPVKKEAARQENVDREIDGVNLTYLTFNKNNEKKLEIKCEESQKKGDDRLLMKKITATIFKADKLDKDIRISADSGYAQNDFNDFYLQGNALISSPSFTLSSKSFDLKDLDVLSTEDAVAFKLRDWPAGPRNGLVYHDREQMCENAGQPKGVLTRAGKPYRFPGQNPAGERKKEIGAPDRKRKWKDAGTLLRGDRISLQFDQDFANLEWAAAYRKVLFPNR